MQARIASSHRGQAALCIGRHVRSEAGQIQFGQQLGLGDARGIDHGQAVVAGGRQHIGLRQAIQRSHHGHALRCALQCHLGHHARGDGAPIQRVQVLLNLGEVIQAVAVGVAAVFAGADDVFGDVGQAVTIRIQQTAGAVGQHEARDHALALCIERQAAQRQRGEGERRDLGHGAGLAAVAAHLGNAVARRVVHQQCVVGIWRQEDVHLAVAVGAAAQFHAG